VDEEMNPIGWRAGPLRASEYLSEMSYGRHSGHYGTGVYFFGSKEAARQYALTRQEGSRALRKIDLRGFNLFRPRDNEAGFELLRAFKVLNDCVWTGGYENVGFSRKSPNMKPVDFTLLALRLERAGLFPVLAERLNWWYAETHMDIEAGNLHRPTASTRFMLGLGYQGVDVRGISGLDDSNTGSVIYKF
jgi:hypothetical protein